MAKLNGQFSHNDCHETVTLRYHLSIKLKVCNCFLRVDIW